MPRPLSIALFIGRFPVVSETFILRQVTGLLDLGHEVDVYSDSGNEAGGPDHPEVAKYRLLDRTTYMKMPQETSPYEMPVWPITGETWPPGSSTSVPNVKRVARALPTFLRCLAHAPRLTLQVLNSSTYGYQAASLSALYRLAGTISRRRSYDILHAHYGPVGNSYRFVRGLLKAPFIVSYYGYDAWAVPRKEGPDVYHRLFETADSVLILADDMGKQLQTLGCPATKQQKLAVGVRVEDFPFRERTRKSGEPIRLLTIARFVEKKGLEYSIRAFAQTLKSGANLIYDIIGDGPLRGRIQKLIAELQIEKQVILHGYREGSQLHQIMDAAHIMVLSSVTASDGDQECTPVSLMDAQASGMPVLSTRHSGIPEVVCEGQSGFLVPERDVGALAERLTHLVEHPEIWAAMGRAGRRHVEQNYNCAMLSGELVGIYEKVIQENRALR
jgi:colanic acid/amylovoran biosynthesis glycosyltransferase